MPLIRNTTALLIAALSVSGCDRGPEPFQMTVDKVQTFQGFILKGLGVSGTVEKGCIANYDAFVVKRKGKVVYEATASIISLDGTEGFEAPANHKVEFYLKDAPEGAAEVGDVLEAKETTCGKGKEK